MPRRLNLPFEKHMEFTEKLDFFASMRTHQRITILKQLAGEIYVYEKGEIIIEEGAEDTALYILLTGLVTVQKGHEEFCAVGALREGDFFGEVSFIQSSPRMASVIANEESFVLRLSQERFLTLDIATQLLVKDKIIQKLISRLNTMNKYVLKLRNSAV